MTSSPKVLEQEDGYILSRNALASARLSYQHQILIARQGFLVHPTITAGVESFSAPLEILDLATGNGIWLTELAHEWKQHNFTGLDYSSAQFPPKSTWADNVTFGTYDFFTDVPQNYVEKFDIVHVRLIYLILWQSPERRVTALTNIKRLLKPGAWLQWQESPPPTFTTFSAPNEDGLCDWVLDFIPMLKIVDRHMGFQTKSMYTNELDKFVRDSGGFEHVQAHWPPTRRDRALYESEAYIWGWEELKTTLFGLPHITQEDKAEILDVHRDLCENMKSGEVSIGFRNIIVVAQKSKL